MNEELDMMIDMAKESMEKALVHLHDELIKIRTGKASPAILNGLKVDYYGTPTLLTQVANIGTSDARTITIQPWEKKILASIERSIFEANLGITPQNDGEIIRLMIPPLTEDRRKDLVKQAKHLGEEAKVSTRNARRDVMEEIKKAIKNGFSEDLGKKKEQKVQELTDQFSKKIETQIEAKEKDIMTL